MTSQSPQFADEVDVPANVNAGLSVASSEFMKGMFGCPRKSYTSQCQPMTNQSLYNNHIVSADVGPFKVIGLRPAVESLKLVFSEILKEQSILYSELGTVGMLCCRYMGSSKNVSNHSWGVAIDLLIQGKLDPYNNGKTYYGLTLIAPIFNRHGWFWGGRYRRSEDAMHFEVSKEKLTEWQRAGIFGPPSKNRQETIAPAASGVISTTSSHDRRLFDLLRKGDQGAGVVLLQNALIAQNYRLAPDGRFGKLTELALVDFQRKHGLIANGIVGPKTAFYLGLH